MTKWETRSIICVPLRSKLRVLGVIQLVNVKMEHFTDQESFFLQSICDYAAIALKMHARWKKFRNSRSRMMHWSV